MTKILKRLEEAGLVDRAPDPEDGRGSRVLLTSRGRSLQDRVFQAFMTATSSLMAPLSEEQKRASDETLAELLAVFENRARERSLVGTRPMSRTQPSSTKADVR